MPDPKNPKHNTSEKTCGWCDALPDVENVLVTCQDIAICAECIARAANELNRLRNSRYRAVFTGIAMVSNQLIDELRAEFRERFQRELLEARDPLERRNGEDEKVSMSVSVNAYTADRVRALAEEAGMSPSQWIRHAIFLAFKATTHRT